MRPSELKQYNSLAAAELRWRYAKKFPYGEGRAGRRWFLPSFHDKMTRALVDLWVLSGLGPADQVVSAGAYVAKAGAHSLGRAIDIDAIHWEYTSLIAHPNYSEPDFYLGVEAHFRCYFHVVLGWTYNADHMGHWHIDDTKKLRPWKASSQMHKRFLQAVLKHVWHDEGEPYYGGEIDGVWGVKSSEACKAVAKRLHLTNDLATDLGTWGRFLQLTAIQGMRVQ